MDKVREQGLGMVERSLLGTGRGFEGQSDLFLGQQWRSPSSFHHPQTAGGLSLTPLASTFVANQNARNQQPNQFSSSPPSSLMDVLQTVQQNIASLQSLLPLVSQFDPGLGGRFGELHSVTLAAGIMSAVSQLTNALSEVLPEQHEQRQQPNDYEDVKTVTLGDLQGNPEMMTVDHVFHRWGGGAAVGGLPSVQNDDPERTNGGHRTGQASQDGDSHVETLAEGSYDVIEMEPVEILAEHTHFCELCGKGFKRDANLRMHMRGHGDEYKTPAALSRPDKGVVNPAPSKPKRFSCPYMGCKRNKNHEKFQPLKTMLCVKNHYRRSHCPKLLTCRKCGSKKFSVVADFKTHEKHCGRDKWVCSCRTTFSRKDKLLGHLALFAGHAPAFPLHAMEEGGCSSTPPRQVWEMQR